jgi:hypothetical protein
MSQTKSFLLMIVFLVVIPAGLLKGEDTLPEKRLALVIGNGDYLTGPLPNPVNDARSMARALRNVGFDVMLRENVSNQTELKRVIREFGQKLKDYDVGMFYYAGHGIQKDGYNFLVPVNAQINSEEEVEYECVDAGFVVALMDAADSRVNIIVLDACRNNPFARTFRSTRQGLVSMNAPAGTIIAYATSPGKTALDGSGVNGLYTQELLYQIQRPGLKIEDVFKNVRIEVMRKSDNKQVPWESSSLTGDFYFKPTREQLTQYFANQGAPVSEAGTFWKADYKNIVLKKNGREILNPKTYPFGEDLIAEDPETYEKYLLRNYWKNRDDRYRPAEKLPATMADYYQSSETEKNLANKTPTQPAAETRAAFDRRYKAKWRGDPQGNFWFTVGVEDVSNKIEVKLVNRQKDLQVYYPGNDAHYYIPNIRNYLDNTWREIYPTDKNFSAPVSPTAMTTQATTAPSAVQPYTGDVKIRWRATRDGTYYLYVNGREISKETNYELKGEDLYVFHPRTGTTFILKNFVNRCDNVMRKGFLVHNKR